MAKIRTVKYSEKRTQHLYNCPGCGYEHAFSLKTEGGHHDSFNGDRDSPTVSPSLVQNFQPGVMCHSFIESGKIRFLSDCTHHLKGQTVDLPDYPETQELFLDFSGR